MPSRSVGAPEGHRQSPDENQDEAQPAQAKQVRGDGEEILQAIRALQDGAGPMAFGPIYHRYFRPLQIFFANQSTLRAEADDLAQETLVRALQKIHQFRFQSSFFTWLLHIGENVWKNAVRDRQAAKRGPTSESLDTLGSGAQEAIVVVQDAYGQTQRNPEELMLARERTWVLYRVLEELPPAMRRCVELRVGHDLKYDEIAQELGISLNSVRSQLFEARRRLKPILERYFDGADL